MTIATVITIPPAEMTAATIPPAAKRGGVGEYTDDEVGGVFSGGVESDRKIGGIFSGGVECARKK